MESTVFYMDWVALGVILGCNYNMIRMSWKAWKHYKDDKFPRCIRAYILWVIAGTIAGARLLASHAFLK